MATREIDFSHMWPTTAVMGVVALLQTGLAMLLRTPLRSWLQRPLWLLAPLALVPFVAVFARFEGS